MRQSKVRFVIVANGIERDLFSVQQRAGGDLLVFLRHLKLAEHPDGSYRPVAEQHYSIHRSKNASLPGNTFKHTLSFKDGELIETSSFVQKSGYPLFYPLFARRCADLDLDRFNTKRSDGDCIINIGNYSTSRSIPFFVAFALESSHYILHDYCHPFSVYSLSFDYFTIAVAIAYFHLPSDESGHLIHFMTSMPRRNREEINPDGRLQGIRSLKLDQLDEFFENIACRMRCRIYDERYAVASRNGQVRKLEEGISVYSATPELS